MSEGSTDPGFRLFDYLALGFILVATEQFARDRRTWQLWAGALGIGVAFLYVGRLGLWARRGLAHLLNQLPKAKALAAAEARAEENFSLYNETSQKLQESLRTEGNLRGHLRASQAEVVGLKQELDKRVKALNEQIQLATQQPVPGSQTRLIIHSANFGPEDGSASEDVTLAMEVRVRNNAIDMIVSDREFPENLPGRRQVLNPLNLRNVLRVVYSYGNQVEAVAARYEGERLELPESAL